MSKKSKKMDEERRKQREKQRRKNHLLCGLILGCIIGFAVGYCFRKRFSDDANKRIVEKDFFRTRLSELKNKLQNMKDHFEDSSALEEEIELTINQA